MSGRVPLQLPVTAGSGAPRLAMSAWLAWTAVSIVVATGSAYGLALIGFAGIELALLTFAAGLAWSAATPRVLRIVGRRLRG